MQEKSGRIASGALGALPSTVATILPGLFLALIIAMAATFMTEHYGGSVMLYALLIGMAFSFLAEEKKLATGVNFSTKIVLSIGVSLLGVRITVAQITGLGMATTALVIAGVAFTIIVGSWLARLLKLKPDHAVLSAGAVAICGASAALAIASVLPKHKNSERNTSLTVLGVTTLSTIAMVAYPLLAQILGMSDQLAGIFIGATIHDVAQVVGAGYMISDTAGETAAIVKLMRVVCLVPVVIGVSFWFRHQTESQVSADGKAVSVPLLPPFLIAFLAIIMLNSFGLVPQYITDTLSELSRWCLITAVAALGMKTSLREVAAVGARPIAVLVVQTLLLALFALAGMALLFPQG
jgi:uncharacterized integral membrane protein (TIGR00698 family)